MGKLLSPMMGMIVFRYLSKISSVKKIDLISVSKMYW